MESSIPERHWVSKLIRAAEGWKFNSNAQVKGGIINLILPYFRKEDPTLQTTVNPQDPQASHPIFSESISSPISPLQLASPSGRTMTTSSPQLPHLRLEATDKQASSLHSAVRKVLGWSQQAPSESHTHFWG